MVVYKMMPGDDDYRFLTKIYVRVSKRYRIRRRKLAWVAVLGLILVIMSVTGLLGISHREVSWYAFLSIGVLSFIYGTYFFLYGAKKQAYKSIKERIEEEIKEEGNGQRTYTFSEEDISVHSEKADSRLSWDLIESCKEEEHYMYLQSGKSYILLDKNRMQESETRELRELAANHIGKGLNIGKTHIL